MKALASEITRKLGKRLQWLQIRVRELTGTPSRVELVHVYSLPRRRYAAHKERDRGDADHRDDPGEVGCRYAEAHWRGRACIGLSPFPSDSRQCAILTGAGSAESETAHHRRGASAQRRAWRRHRDHRRADAQAGRVYAIRDPHCRFECHAPQLHRRRRLPEVCFWPDRSYRQT